jgi:DNA repair protein RadC
MAEKKQTGHRQRLRDRFARGEEKSRSEEALLELLLTYAIPQKDVGPLAKKLLSDLGSLSAVLEAPIDTLIKTDGIKDTSAVLLKLVDFIGNRHVAKAKRGPAPKPAAQATLFEMPLFSEDGQAAPSPGRAKEQKVTPRRGTDLFVKAILKETIQILPRLPDTESLDEIRLFLRAELHFSAEQTRHRYANYIIRRMFPDGLADRPLRLFAKRFPKDQALRDVCFYRFMKAEPLEAEVIEALLIPSIGTGRLSRERIKQYLAGRYPSSQSIKDSSQAIVEAMVSAGVAKADKVTLTYAYREIPVPAFAFILHSEFPEPGMYDIKKVEQNPFIRAMLWNPEQLLSSLYELRNLGLLAKISEIDSIRQFTTRHALVEVVDRLAAGGNKA